MCALLRATGVITEYQRDSSSKRPLSSVVLATRYRVISGPGPHPGWLRAPPWPEDHA
jgi:hypothetical protein